MSSILRLFRPEDLPRKKRRHWLPRFLSWPEAMRLLDWCIAEIGRHSKKRKAGAIRDEIMIRLGLFLGLRCCEIHNLDVTDIDLTNRSAAIRDSKGGRHRYVPIPEKLVPHLERLIGTRTDGMLIIGRLGARLNRRTICWRTARAASRAGISVHVHPHLLRHTYATHFLESWGNIRSLQMILGHSDLATTAVYLDVDVSKFAADVNRM